MKQTRPSCWIYVVEAVADAYQQKMGYQHWDTSLLAAIINLYPRDMNSRENEFGTIEQDFATIIANFQQISLFKDRISREHIEKIVERVIRRRDAEQRPNIAMFMQIFFPQPGEYRLTEVIAGFGKARDLARELKLTIRAHGNTEGELLGGRATTSIGPNDDDSDI